MPQLILHDFNVNVTDTHISFDNSCPDLPIPETYPKISLDYKLVSRDGQEKLLTLNLQDLLVSGEVLGMDPDKCYLAVFANTYTVDPFLTYFGTLFLKKYYSFFDMSGFDPESNQAGRKLRVGIGERNKNN